MLKNAANTQKLQKGAYPNKKVRTCLDKKYKYNDNYREQNSLNIFTEVKTMALKDIVNWNETKEAPASACGTACGASDKPAETPAACGAGDK